MNAYPETPDAWIERQPEDDGSQRDDACMVCDKIECVCVPEDDFPSILQSAEDLRR